jgi:hypothetical protein
MADVADECRGDAKSRAATARRPRDTAAMRRWEQLNERQLAVLRRVGSGEDLGASSMTGAFKVSAGALRDRGLLAISRRGGQWRASLTEAGRYYLDHGRHPDHPPAPTTASAGGGRSAPRRHTTVDNHEGGPAVPIKVRSKRQPRADMKVMAERRAAATDLVAQLASTRIMRIAQLDEEAVGEWRRVVDFAKRHRLLPADTRIEKQRTHNGDLVLRLLDGVHANSRRDTPGGLQPVPVPGELRLLHPVVAALRDDDGRLVMSESQRRRCLLVLHGLTSEAVSRGYGVQAHPVHRSQYREFYDWKTGRHFDGYSRREGELTIIVKGFEFTITIDEASPMAEDLDRSNRLYVEVIGEYQYACQHRWTDGKRASVEGKLAAVLREIENRAAGAERCRLEMESEEADRQALRNLAIERARVRAARAHYANTLLAQANDWHTARRIRTYCDALEKELDHGVDDDTCTRSTRKWLRWARDYAENLDPLNLLPVMPDLPDFKPDELKQYLDGWDA